MPKFVLKIFKTKDFEKSFAKLPPKIQILSVKKISLFENKPFNPSFKTHKLKGELQKFYSFSEHKPSSAQLQSSILPKSICRWDN